MGSNDVRLEYIKTLPYATVLVGTKESFREAAKECNAVSVSDFTAELRRQIDEYFDLVACDLQSQAHKFCDLQSRIFKPHIIKL